MWCSTFTYSTTLRNFPLSQSLLSWEQISSWLTWQPVPFLVLKLISDTCFPSTVHSQTNTRWESQADYLAWHVHVKDSILHHIPLRNPLEPVDSPKLQKNRREQDLSKGFADSLPLMVLHFSMVQSHLRLRRATATHHSRKTFCDIPIPSGRGTCENASNIFQTICKVEYVSCICLKGSDKCSVHFAVVLFLHAFSCLFRSSLSSFSYLSSSVKETLGWCQKSSVSKGKDVTGVGPQSISLL